MRKTFKGRRTSDPLSVVAWTLDTDVLPARAMAHAMAERPRGIDAPRKIEIIASDKTLAEGD